MSLEDLLKRDLSKPRVMDGGRYVEQPVPPRHQCDCERLRQKREPMAIEEACAHVAEILKVRPPAPLHPAWDPSHREIL